MYTLERISNVDSGFFMRQQAKKGAAFEKYLRRAYDGRNTAHQDSAEFSPAAVFLQRIKWQLRGMKRSHEDKLQFHFLVDNIEFFTEIDEHQLLTPGRQHFRVIDYFLLNGKQIQVTLLSSIERQAAFSVDEYQIQTLDSLKTFFDRALTDSVVHPMPFSAIPEFAWSEGLGRGLESELQNILVGIMGVAEKVLQLPIPKKAAHYSTDNVVSLEKLMINEYNK